MLSLCACKENTTEFSAVVVGSYTDYISVVTVDPAVDFIYADIKINVATLPFTPKAGRSIKVTSKKITAGDPSYIVVPKAVEKIDSYFTKITADEALNMLADSTNAVIIDARNAAEYKYGHIKGSINITTENLKSKINLLPKDYNTPIICYSKSTDGRSEEMAQFLISLNYTSVYDMGDIDAWPGKIEAE